MPADPTSRTPLLRLPGMRRTDAPGLGRTNPEVRRNVPRLRRLLTPKISRRRQPTETLMMMITEECHPEEMQAFATRPLQRTAPDHQNLQPSTQNVILRKCRPSQREGLPTKDPCTTHRGGRPRLSRSLYSRGCPVHARLGGGFPRLSESATSPPYRRKARR